MISFGKWRQYQFANFHKNGWVDWYFNAGGKLRVQTCLPGHLLMISWGHRAEKIFGILSWWSWCPVVGHYGFPFFQNWDKR